MNQTLKYGLTTSLKSFSLPETYNDKEIIVVQGANELKIPVHDHENEFLATKQKGQEKYFAIPDNTKGTITIHRTCHGACSTRIHIAVGANCTIRIIETMQGDGTLAGNTTLSADTGSHITYSILQNMQEDAIVLLNYEAWIANSTIEWFFCGVGGQTTQAHIATHAGENAQTKNNAVIFGTKKQQFDIHVSTYHKASDSKSDMLTRSVLDDQARAVYHGLIHIAEDASNCDSYQKDEVILLSENAGADAIPNLEICNNNVRCSHGASIGKLDEEKLFYFLSRGIEKQEAKRMITEGFLETLFTEPWQHVIHEKISRS